METDRARDAARAWADAEVSGLQLVADVVIGGKYRLLRPAGFGGMGTVWVAENQATGAEVALKVLRAEDAASAEAVARFRREAHAAARLSHRGIVRVFDLVELEGEHAGALVLVMELLHGETLADHFDRQQKLGVDEALAIAMPLLSALAHAHAAGIVHRDLKPENVFLSVDPDGHTTPKILDFGISKLNAPEAPRITDDGALLGTPAYMSPEQARGANDVAPRSDVFTMGILLYEMLAGANPFASGSYHSVTAAILERDPEPIAGIPEELWHVLAKALAKRPEDRYESAVELAHALRDVTGAPTSLPLHPVSHRPPAPETVEIREAVPSLPPMRAQQATLLDAYGIEKRRRRGMKIVAVLGGVAGVLAIAGAVISRTQPGASTTGARPPTPPEPPHAQPVSPPVLDVEALPAARPTGHLGAPAAAVPRAAPPRASAHRPAARPPPAPPVVTASTAPTPPPASVETAEAPAPARPSTVVRDPGF